MKRQHLFAAACAAGLCAAAPAWAVDAVLERLVEKAGELVAPLRPSDQPPRKLAEPIPEKIAAPEKPTEKPVEKPAEKIAEKPPEPAKAKPAALQPLPNDRPNEKIVAPAERSGVVLTLYGNGSGLVADRRRLELAPGGNAIAWTGMPARTKPETAMLHDGAGIKVNEQTFLLPSPQVLLERSVGRAVAIVRTDPATGRDVVSEAKLVSAGEGGVVVQYDGLLYAERAGQPSSLPGRLALAGMPPGMQPTPTLRLLLDAPQAGPRELEIDYLADGLGWSADYTAVLDAASQRLDLEARASISNQSGGDFNNASVDLVAGDTHRIDAHRNPPGMVMARAASALPPGLREETMGEYHLYHLDQLQTLVEGESKQVALLSAKGVPADLEYRLEGQSRVYLAQDPEGQTLPVSTRLTIGSGTGFKRALPAGALRVYQNGEGGLRLIGEDRIGHLAVGEIARVTLGSAFDLTASRRQTEFMRMSNTPPVFESAHQIELRSAKAEMAVVVVAETMPGDWVIVQESHPHETIASDKVLWRIPVLPGQKTVFSYRVRVRQ